MKNVEAVGICVARVVAADPGLSANCWIELINPEARVTMKKVCYKQLLELQSSNHSKRTITRNRKYRVIRFISTSVLLGIPSNAASSAMESVILSTKC